MVRSSPPVAWRLRALFRRIRSGVLAVPLALAVAGPAAAQGESGLPIPRFVSLRSDEVNLRTGPGMTYPVDWVYLRDHMPVEVIAEFEGWRKVRDWQGTVGWVHQSMLDGRRTALVVGREQVLRDAPEPNASAVARLAPGVIGRLLECEAAWCRIEVKGYEGWLQRDAFWGAYPNETVK